MSVDLDRQLREYCRDMDEKQGALSFTDVLERSGELQVIPRRGNQQRSPRRRWIAAAAVAVVVVVIGIGFLLGTDGTTEPANTPPPPTTVAPDVESMTDLDVIEAGVAALYSGNADTAVELFELADRTDDEIRQESAYQRAIEGRLDVNCAKEATPGVFTCTTAYHNTATETIGYVDPSEVESRVVVKDGVITEFVFPEHTWFVKEMGTFLASEGRFESYGDCVFGPFPESCAAIQLANLDGWAEWRDSFQPADEVEVALESWYGGDCEAALFLAPADILWGSDDFDDCSTSSSPTQTIEYESILGAQVSVENCVETSAGGEGPTPPPQATPSRLSCEVHYSNTMNSAVGKPPSMIARDFTVPTLGWGVRELDSEEPWYQGVYPEDTELRESFRTFAEGGELASEYAAANCANTRSPECATLILDNLDEWAAWYESNS